MAQLTLPQNSKVGKGKHFPADGAPSKSRRFKIYRYDPDSGENPRTDTYDLDLDHCGPMVLDALIKIKNEVDATLTFRRSCREGICGSCAMNVDGTNTLACIKPIDEVKGEVRIYPAAAHAGGEGPGAGHGGFLCPVRLHRALDEDGYRAHRPPPERLQAPEDREKLDGLYECILCACCSTSCPELLVEQRSLPGPRDPAAGLPLACRQPRRGDRRAARRAGGPSSGFTAATPS